jgi:hypothetical protein
MLLPVFRVELRWMMAKSPNRTRREPLSSRSGHEAADRQEAKEAAEKVIASFGKPDYPAKTFIPYTVIFCYPTFMERDALNCHFAVKAIMDGICDALGLDDAYLWRAVQERGDPCVGGKVVVEIGRG